MSTAPINVLQTEWVTLQTQYDSYEKCSLGIKLFNILQSCMLVFAFNIGIWSLSITAILWLQDAIWKTFQSRIGQRLEVVEHAIEVNLSSEPHPSLALGMQFNLAWNQTRPNALKLISEYLKQGLKPTVAYPHVMLMAVLIARHYIH